jgi:DHA2 family multidrug resistance protein-like MFS transporter
MSSKKATRREWIGLGVLALPCMLTVMDMTVLNLAVPRLDADLRPTSAQLLWIIDIYGFMLAGWLVTMGTIGDRIGRRRLLLIGATAFGLASTLAAFATSATMLIAARAFLGISGATLVPSTLSLLRSMFHDERERASAIGVWGSSLAVGSIVGPLVGGLLLQYFWWGSVFLVALPVMALVLILGPRLLPEFRDPSVSNPDGPSVILSIAAVHGVIYGLKQIVQNGLDPLSVLAMLLGVALGMAFLRRQRNLAEPLIDLSLFRDAVLNVALATNTLNVFVSLGSFLFISQYLQLVLGLTPLQAGLCTLPASVAAIVAPNLAPLAVRKLGRAATVSTALVITAAGFVVISQAHGPLALALIIIGWSAWAFGGCGVVILGTGAVLSSAPPERAGAVSAVMQTCQELGGALGIAVLGSVGAAVYRAQVAASPMTGLQPQAAATGLQISSIIGALLMLLMAAVAAVCMRERNVSEVSPVAANERLVARTRP